MKISVLAMLLAISAGLAQASLITFQGTFTHDDEVALFDLTLLAPSNVQVITWSYGGGVNGGGTTILPGGFDPYLSIFDGGTGLLIATNEDGSCPPLNAGNGHCFDADLSVSLPTGDYRLALTESGNFPNGPTLADGFSAQGTGDFTGGPFLDLFADQQDGHWALDFVQVDTAVPLATPEPQWLTAIGLTLLAIGRMRRRSH